MLIFPLNFVDTMIMLRAELLDEAVPFMGLAASIASIGAIICTVRFSSAIMNGQNVRVWDILKPLLVIVLCSQFSLVTRALDIVPNGLSAVVAGMTPDISATNQKSIKEMFREAQETENQRNAELHKNTDPNGAYTEGDISSALGESQVTTDEGSLNGASGVVDDQSVSSGESFILDDGKEKGGLWEGFKHMLAGLWQGFVNNVFCALCQIVLTVMTLAIPVIIGFSQIYLTFLAFLGPFTLALGNFPGLGGFGSWVTRYLQTSFWMPMAYLLKYMYDKGIQVLIAGVTIDEFSAAKEQLGRISAKALALGMFGFVCFMGIFSIPTLASYVVESAGLAGIGSKAAAPVKQGAASAGRAALNRIMGKGKGASVPKPQTGASSK